MNNEQELRELASQLRNPNGGKGSEIGVMMNEVNAGMIRHSIDHLHIAPGDFILELGHGNGGHLPYLFAQNDHLTYYGLDISELMHEEAKQFANTLDNKKDISFSLYDGLIIPFTENYFHKIFTVNTIYFWSDPTLLASELYRVIKPGGLLNITFGQARFMEQIPFTKYEFELYTIEKISSLFNSTQFSIVTSHDKTEMVKSKTGDMVERDFTTIILKK